MTPEELKELREIVGKAIGMDGPYTWGIDDYVAVAEHFREKGRRQCLRELWDLTNSMVAENE